MEAEAESILNQLLDEDLSGITFVRDYLQLQFNPPPIINVYTACRLKAEGKMASFGEPDFANLIIQQIGKDVTGVSMDEDTIVLVFADDSQNKVSPGQAPEYLEAI